MDIRDMRIDEFSNAGKTVGMRIIHQPTGLMVEGSGESRFKLKEALLKEINRKHKELKDS